MMENLIFFSHTIARLQCFIFLKSVRGVIIFRIFDRILQIFWKKFSFSTISFDWNVYRSGYGNMIRINPIRIYNTGLLVIPYTADYTCLLGIPFAADFTCLLGIPFAADFTCLLDSPFVADFTCLLGIPFVADFRRCFGILKGSAPSPYMPKNKNKIC
jgi:hypothetical protein